MKTIQQGFTLIELMIVVAIIGILAAIAIPQYNNYVAQSQITAALAEISGGKTQYENRLQRGDDEFQIGGTMPTDPDDSDAIGLQDETSACSEIAVSSYSSNASAADDAAAEIRCTLTGNPQVEGNHLSLDRLSSGAWQCITSDLPSDLLPGNCSG